MMSAMCVEGSVFQVSFVEEFHGTDRGSGISQTKRNLPLQKQRVCAKIYRNLSARTVIADPHFLLGSFPRVGLRIRC
jgi:hypothetical protein